MECLKLRKASQCRMKVYLIINFIINRHGITAELVLRMHTNGQMVMGGGCGGGCGVGVGKTCIQ